jgi:O-antigen/teichoic acid export membrane protein
MKLDQFFRYARAGGSIGAARIVAQGAQFLTFIIAARFLGVEQFGVYALVLVSIMFLLLFAGFGWGQLAATQDEEREEALGLARWAGSGLCLLVVIANLVVWQMGWITNSVMVLGLFLAPLLMLRAMTNVWIACLIVDGKAAKVAGPEAISEVVAMAVAITALFSGLGLLSLGIAKLAQEIVAYLLIRRSAPFRTTRPADKTRVWRQIRFAQNIIGGRAIYFLNDNISTILVGLLLGAADTGLYRAGARLSASGREVIVESMRATFWMRLKESSPEDRRRSARDLIFWAVVAASLVLAGLALVADLVVQILLGEAWAAASLVASLLAVRGILLMPQAILESVLSFTNTVQLGPRLAFISALASTLLLIAFTPLGLAWAAASQVLAALVTVATTGWALNRVLELRPREFLFIFWKPAVCAMVMAAAVLGFRMLHADASLPAQLVELFGSMGIGLTTFVVSLCVLHKPVRGYLWHRLNLIRAVS